MDAQLHFWSRHLGECLQVVTVVVGIVTVWLLWRYTVATQKLLREAQRQTEVSLMPIVVLATTTTQQGLSGPCLVVRNLGRGPAFNTTIRPLNDTDGITYRVQHRATIAAGEREGASLYMDKTSLQGIDLINILQRQAHDSPMQTSIAYKGVNGRSYETAHTISLTSDGKDLIIHFDNFSVTGQA